MMYKDVASLLALCFCSHTAAVAEPSYPTELNRPIHAFVPMEKPSKLSRFSASAPHKPVFQFNSRQGSQLRVLFKQENGMAFVTAGLSSQGDTLRPRPLSEQLQGLSAGFGYAFKAASKYQVAVMVGTHQVSGGDHALHFDADGDGQNWISATIGINLY